MRNEFDKNFLKNISVDFYPIKIENCKFFKNKVVTLKEILDSDLLLVDKFCFVNKYLLNSNQKIDLSLKLLKFVLPIYEHKYGKTLVLRKSLSALEKYINKKITEKELKNITIKSYALGREIENKEGIGNKYSNITKAFDADFQIIYLLAISGTDWARDNIISEKLLNLLKDICKIK